MERSDAINYINKALRTSSIEWISLTGGEPMLFPNLIEELIAYASENGMKTELVTNCFWADSPLNAERSLRRLQDAGLDVLNFSADDFHQTNIPFERVRNCYVAGKKLSVKMVVMTSVSKSSNLRLAGISRLLGENIPPPGILDTAPHAAIGIESGFTPIGRGAKIPKEDWLHDDSPEFGGCNSILSDLGVRPNGDLLPCCSAPATLPALHLGSLDDAEFMNLLSDAWKREVFRTLRNRGPAGLVGNLDTSKYVNRCHLCYEVVKDL